MKPIRHILTAVATALVMAASALAAPTVQAAERLNPFRPLDGIYYSAQASGTAMNWTHIRSNLFFAVINEYDFEGTGKSRWYTFLLELNYNNPTDFAPSVGWHGGSPCAEACGSIGEVARPYEHATEPAATNVIAYGTAELVESTRPPGEPHESHLTGVEVEVVFYSTSSVDVTYNGKTSRFRIAGAAPEFTVTDELTNAAYDVRGSKSWVANPTYNTIPPGSLERDLNPGEEKDGCLDHLADKWREVPDGLGWTKDDDRGAKLIMFDGYKMPPEVPRTEKEPGQDMFYFREFLFPGSTDAGTNNNNSTLGVFWDPEFDRGFAYIIGYSSSGGTYNRSTYLGIVLRTLDGFRITDPYSYEEGVALGSDGDPKTNPNGRYQFYELTRY